MAPLSETLRCKRSCRCAGILSAIIFGAASLFFAGVVSAEEVKKKEKKEKIFVTADKLISHTDKNISEFIGNVKVVQADTVIHADRMKILHQSVSKKKKSGRSDTQTVNRILAFGNVRIKFGDRVAQSAKAEYITDQGKLILSGPNTRVTGGKNFISGSKITLYRNQERIQVNGRGGNVSRQCSSRNDLIPVPQN